MASSSRTDLFQGQSFLEFLSNQTGSSSVGPQFTGDPTAAANRAEAWRRLSGQAHQQMVNETMQAHDPTLGGPAIRPSGPFNVARSRIAENPFVQGANFLAQAFFTPDNTGLATGFGALRQGAKLRQATSNRPFRQTMGQQLPTSGKVTDQVTEYGLRAERAEKLPTMPDLETASLEEINRVNNDLSAAGEFKLFSTNAAQNLPAATRVTNVRQLRSGRMAPEDAANAVTSGFENTHLNPAVNRIFDQAESLVPRQQLQAQVDEMFAPLGEPGLEAAEHTMEMSEVFRDMGKVRQQQQVGSALEPMLGPATKAQWLETASESQKANMRRMDMARLQGHDTDNMLFHITDRLEQPNTDVVEFFDPVTGKVFGSVQKKHFADEELNKLADEIFQDSGIPVDFDVPSGGEFTKFKDNSRGFIFFGQSPTHSAAAAQSRGSRFFDPAQAQGAVDRGVLENTLQEVKNARIFPVYTRAKIMGKDPNPGWMDEAIEHAKLYNPGANEYVTGALTDSPRFQFEIWNFIPEEIFTKLDAEEKIALTRWVETSARANNAYPSGLAPISWQDAEGGIFETLIEKLGYQGMHVSDEAGTSTAILPKHANTIRSIWAKFNPLDMMDNDLSAAIAGAIGTGVVSSAKKDSN